MRVKPTSGGPSPIDPTQGAERVDGAAPVEQGGAVAGVAPTEAAAGAAPADVVSQVARRLREGEISAGEAVELLIDDAVQRQVGRVTSDREALAGELKALLRRYTESDPYLASKVRRLGQRR
jgi:hypothetical protein